MMLSGMITKLMEMASKINREQLAISIHQALQELGYDVEITSILTPQTKAALVKFRKDYNIHITCRFDGTIPMLLEIAAKKRNKK